MISNSKIVAFAATKDAAGARTFYEDVLGLRLISDDSFALVFDANGVMLRIQKVQKLTPAPYTALGCADMDAEVDALVTKGVAFNRYGWFPQDERGIWTAPSGARIAWFNDPDGNTLSLTQFK